MKKELSDRISKLSVRNQNCFYYRLHDILNDRKESFTYGLSGKDYVNLPQEKLENVEEKVYEELFGEKKDPPKLKAIISLN